MVGPVREMLSRRDLSDPDAYLWPTANGRPRDGDSLRTRILAKVVEDARELCSDLPKRITPHTFRRTGLGSSTLNLVRLAQPVLDLLGALGPRRALVCLQRQAGCLVACL
jgi:hypothetical protein